MAAAIAQTIAIVDKSGKVVSTSKQLKNIFNEAKVAYLERKAEVKAERRAKEDHELHKAVRAMTIANESRSDVSRSRSRHHRSRSRQDGEHRPRFDTRPSAGERGYSGRSVTSSRDSANSCPRSPHSPPSYSRRHSSYRSPQIEDDDYYNTTHSGPPSPVTIRPMSQDLTRRRTDMDVATVAHPRDQQLARANSTSAIDMDLAYGDFHPESLTPYNNSRDLIVQDPKQELTSLVQKCNMLLDEAKCATSSVKAIVAHLQQNPDAMAAVALTLAEISNVASKMAPGALMTLKAGAPTVFALLAAPEFLIAVGVSVGITVVMFGGYKIIKKIQAAKRDKADGMDEMVDVEELSRIDHWRRGITFGGDDASVISAGTSVEGEFITPNAARSLGHLPREEGRSDRRKREKKADKDRKSEAKSQRKEAKSKSSRTGSVAPSESVSNSGRAMVKVKKPSPLRRMFKGSDASSRGEGRSSASGRQQTIQEI